MKKVLLGLVTAMLLLSCKKVIDQKVSLETAKEDVAKIKEENKGEYTDADFDKMGDELAGSVFRAALSKGKDGIEDGVKFDKTYREYLDEAKSQRIEQEELAAKMKKEELARQAKMKSVITVSIYKKEFIPSSFEAGRLDDYNVFDYAIENKSDKEIKAMKFSFSIKNALGDDIGNGYEIDVTDDRIAPKSVYKNRAAYDYNQFENSDKKIANAKFEDLTFDIDVLKIVYSDGTVLE